MSEPSPLITIVLAQSLIFAIAASVAFYFLWRRAVKKLKTRKIPEAQQETPQTQDKPDARIYLGAEQQASHDHYVAIPLEDEEGLSEAAITKRLLLQLREDYLALEKRYVSQPGKHKDKYWSEFVDDLRQLLVQHGLYTTINAKAHNKDDIGLLKTIGVQKDKIDELRLSIKDNIEAEQIAAQLGEILDILQDKNGEISEGIHVLENENDFLREQVQELINS